MLDIQLDSDVNSSHIASSASVTDPRSETTVASLPDSLIALATDFDSDPTPDIATLADFAAHMAPLAPVLRSVGDR